MLSSYILNEYLIQFWFISDGCGYDEKKISIILVSSTKHSIYLSEIKCTFKLLFISTREILLGILISLK